MMEKKRLIALVTAVRQKKAGADGELYDAFYEDIYHYILEYVGKDVELAADLTQDTFMEILQTIDKLREPAAFVTWSKQIATHKCTAYFRKRREILLDEAEDGYSVFDTVEEDRAEFIPDAALDQEEFRGTIHAMLDELPAEQRSALLLRYFNEISVKEIAHIQGVSEGTVKSRLNYARKALKQAVEDYEKKNGIRLHSVGVLPMLLWFFRAYRRANGMAITAGSATAVYGAAAATTGSTAATAATAAAAATTEKTGLAAGISAISKAAATKVVAGVAAATVAVAGVAAVVSGPDLPEKWSGYVESYWMLADNINAYYAPENHEYYASQTPVENNRMYVELEVLEEADSTYNGTIQITWEDGEVYYSDCQLVPGSGIGYYPYYTVVMDPVYWKEELDPINRNVISSMDLIYSEQTDTLFVRGLNRYELVGELTRETSGKTIFRDPPKIREEEPLIDFGRDWLIYMQRIDGTYGWVTAEEAEQIEDYYAPMPVDGSPRVGYRYLVFFKEPDGNQVSALMGISPIYREQVVNLVVPAEFEGYPVTEIRQLVDEYMESVELPETITVIPENCLHHSWNLKTVKLPFSIRTIENRAFMYCTSLESLEIPEGVETLGNQVFAYDKSLKSVRFPATVTRLGTEILFGCSGLETIEVAPGNPVYHSSGNCLIETESKTLIAGCSNSAIPGDGSVTIIGKLAFAGNQSLTEIVIPEGVTKIGYAAFAECNSLTVVHLPRSMEAISEQAFKFCGSLTDIYYAGTMEEFANIQGIYWDGAYQAFGMLTVHCSDGNLAIGG